MASDWFRLNNAGDGTEKNPNRPDLKGHDVSYSGNVTHPNGPPGWVVRVHGTEEELDALESDLSGSEKRLDNVPTEALNNMLGQNRDAAGWERGFSVGGSE